jgi:hypothetical protein
MPLTLADIRVWYPWGTPWLEITDGGAYPSGARVDASNADLNARLRKLTTTFVRTAPGGALTDDAMQVGLHLLNEDGDGSWASGDFEAVESAWDDFWASLKPHYLGTTKLAEYVWHRAGPAYDPPSSPGSAVRRAPRDLPGTGTNLAQLPYQVAVTLTERTMLRKRWGRMYLPAPSHSLMEGSTGRITSTFRELLANAAQTLYVACLDADLVPVVYSPAAGVRASKRGGTLPAKPAAALKVNTLQVDDVPDVIRSRRLKSVAARSRRGAAVT